MSDERESYTIFLSYKEPNYFTRVKHLSDFFESKGFKTLYAPRNIDFGEVWYEKIPMAIEECDALVLIFCNEADKSRFIGDEIRLAREKDKAIFYLRVEEDVFPKRLNFLIGSYQWRNWFDESDETPLQEIADLIRKKTDDSENAEHEGIRQSNTKDMFLSDELARRTRKFVASMNSPSALKQIMGGFFPLLTVASTTPIIAGNITTVAANTFIETRSTNEKPFIFLSYPNVKAEAVRTIADFLERRGFKAWYSARDVRSGAKKFEDTAKAIENCDAFICVLCSESDKKENCANELVYAVDRNKLIFTVRTENFESRRRLSLFLDKSKYIDWFNITDKKPLEGLSNILSELLKR